jgi:hypothetical protein
VIKQFDAQRVSKLVLMLSSQHDGEVVSAARAISRTLKSTGADWHDLVAGLTRQPTSRAPHEADDTVDPKDWREMRQVCLDQLQRLREREQKFIDSIGNWNGDLTDKQFQWLKSIYLRVKPGQRR